MKRLLTLRNKRLLKEIIYIYPCHTQINSVNLQKKETKRLLQSVNKRFVKNIHSYYIQPVNLQKEKNVNNRIKLKNEKTPYIYKKRNS